MNIVLLGAPASGKGTQAELLAKKFNLYLFSTGNLSRDLAKKDTRIKRIIESGQLIPQEEMTMYVLDYLKQNKKELSNILFEGYPRFISQYQALDGFLKSKGDDIDAVISLDISRDEAIRRITSRRMCVVCGRSYNLITNPPATAGVCACGGKLVQRKDDSPNAVKTRFQYYRNNTKQLIDYLDKKRILIRVDGERPIEEIFKDLSNIVQRFK